MAEVRRLLGEGEAAIKLCKPWLPKPALQHLRGELAVLKELVSLSAMLHPRQDRQPALASAQELEAMDAASGAASGATPAYGNPALPTCSGCGQPSFSLRKCARCKTAACELWHGGQGHVHRLAWRLVLDTHGCRGALLTISCSCILCALHVMRPAYYAPYSG